MMLQIPYSLDEFAASGQFPLDRRRRGNSPTLFFHGDAVEGGARTPGEGFKRPACEVLRNMFGGGSLAADAAGIVAGMLLIAPSMPRGGIDNRHGAWNRCLL